MSIKLFDFGTDSDHDPDPRIIKGIFLPLQDSARVGLSNIAVSAALIDVCGQLHVNFISLFIVCQSETGRPNG